MHARQSKGDKGFSLAAKVFLLGLLAKIECVGTPRILVLSKRVPLVYRVPLYPLAKLVAVLSGCTNEENNLKCPLGKTSNEIADGIKGSLSCTAIKSWATSTQSTQVKKHHGV